MVHYIHLLGKVVVLIAQKVFIVNPDFLFLAQGVIFVLVVIHL